MLFLGGFKINHRKRVAENDSRFAASTDVRRKEGQVLGWKE